MNIQDFNAKLSSDNNRTPMFASLRKLTAMDSAAIQDSDAAKAAGEWAIWNGSTSSDVTTA